MAGYGIQDASIALIGQAVGAHRRDMAKRFAWLCTMMGIGIMALSGVGLWLFAPALMGIFTADAAVIALGAQVLRIEAFAEPMFGASIVASGAMQGLSLIHILLQRHGQRILCGFPEPHTKTKKQKRRKVNTST